MANNTALHLVPEKYQKTRFTANCWFYLSKNPRLSFVEYQKVSKDWTCRKNVFEDVKKEMALERLFKNPEAMEEQPRQHPPPPPPPPNTTMQEAFAKGLARNGQQTRHGPVTVERRAEAEKWIGKNLDHGFAQFKRAHPEPELDKAWFDKVRKKFLHPSPSALEDIMPEKKRASGRQASPDLLRLRNYMGSLSPERLRGLTYTAYVEKTGHRSMKSTVFNWEKNRKIQLLDGKKKVSRRKKSGLPAKAGGRKGKAPASTPAPSGPLFSILAEIEISGFKCESKALRLFAEQLVKQIHPKGESARIVMLTDPPTMEIRLPA